MARIKLFTLLVAFILVLSSCGVIIINNGKKVETSEGESVTTEYQVPEYPIIGNVDHAEEMKKRFESLPKANLNGTELFISAESEAEEFFSDEKGPYSDEIGYIKGLISDRYNVSIIISRQSSDLNVKGLTDAVNMGQYYCDFVVPSQKNFSKYYLNGCISNLEGLPYVDFDSEAYNKAGLEKFTYDGDIFGAVGSLTENPEAFACLYLNKGLAKEYGINVDYVDIFAKGFTFDDLYGYINAVDDGGIPIVSATDDKTLALNTFLASGEEFIKADSDFKLRVDYNNNRTAGIIHAAKTIISKIVKKTSVKVESTNGQIDITLSGFDIFTEGYSLLAYGRLGDVRSISYKNIDFEILPLPKYDEAQSDYFSGTPIDTAVICFAKTSTEVDGCGLVLNGLFTCSQGYFADKLISDARKNYVTSVYTVNLMEMIASRGSYDYAVLFSGNSNVVNSTYNAYYNVVSGKNSISYYLDKYKANADKYLPKKQR